MAKSSTYKSWLNDRSRSQRGAIPTLPDVGLPFAGHCDSIHVSPVPEGNLPAAVPEPKPAKPRPKPA
jgi:hypothetical protein